MPTTRRLVACWGWGLLAVVALGGGAWTFLRSARQEGAVMPSPAPVGRPLPADIAGQVHAFCGGSCHTYPPPDVFPRRYWRNEVVRGFRFFELSGKATKAPLIESVVRYYEERAPDELPSAALPPAPPPPAVRFDRTSYPTPVGGGRPAISHVSAVFLPPPGRSAGPGRDRPALLACDMQGGRVMLLRPSDPAPAWQVLARVPHPAHADVVDLDRDGLPDILVADLGSFLPSDERCGGVVWLRGRPDGSFTPVKLLENVGRVADVRAADFSGTGKLDLIVGVFGLHTAGEILHLRNRTTDWAKPEFVRRQVDARHGAIHVPVADLDGDGKPDFVALIAQEHEVVVAFLNDGAGGFQKRTLYAAPHPAYGSSGIQLVDLNADGQLDVLYTNGDILDEPYLFKPYHGVQWLENTGGLRFVHHPITPMYGAHNAIAADIFGTGRPAVVAVSFLPAELFPDRAARRADAVVLLEQVAPGVFDRHSLATIDCDAVVCAAGDLYGTGRPDIVIGNFGSAKTDDPVAIWKNLGPAKAK